MGVKLEAVVNTWLAKAKEPLELAKFEFTMVSGELIPRLFIHDLQYSVERPEVKYAVRHRSTLDAIHELHESLLDTGDFNCSSLKVSASLTNDEWSLNFDYRP